jgi:hypothetical protein
MSVELGIALLALLFTFYQAWLSRHHNRLSVIPHLQWSHTSNWTDHGLDRRIAIQNHGLGPARIKKAELFLQGKLFEPKSSDPAREIIEKAFDGIAFTIISTSFPAPDYSIKAADEYLLLLIRFPNLKREDAKKLDSAEIDARIHYESFYGDDAVLDSRA